MMLAFPLLSALWAIAMVYLSRRPLSEGAVRGLPSFGLCCLLVAAATMLPFGFRAPTEALGRALVLGMLCATGIVDLRTGFIFDLATVPCAGVSVAVAAFAAPGFTTLAACSVVLPIAGLAACSRGAFG